MVATADQNRDLVDPELLELLALFPSDPIGPDNLSARRRVFFMSDPRTGNVEDGIERETLRFEGAAGDPAVEAIVYRPKGLAGPLPALLHIHGGGFVTGSPERAAADDATYVRELGCAVVAVRYRLAPENPYPAAINDCYAALDAIHRHADELDIDRRAVAVLGDSAGGGLAAAMSLMARDRGTPAVAAQILVGPMLDDRTVDDAEPNRFTGMFGWTRESNRFGWAALKGKLAGSADIPAYLAPARATDLSGMPPTFISCGSLDLFVDESIDFARRLMRAGVPTELHIYPRAFHGFRLAKKAEVAQRANRAAIEALRQAFGRARSPG